MENFTENKKLEITEKFQKYFKETGGWALFLAILGFVAIGFMILGGLILGLVFMSYSSRGSSEIGLLIMISYIVLAGVLFFPTLYMLKSALGFRAAIKSHSDEDYDKAFRNLKNYFKFVGIMTIAIIGLYLIIFLVVGAGALMSNINY